MASDGKLDKLLRTRRNPQEVEYWLFSLIPLGVAFVFFFIFLLPMNIPNKDMVMVIGVAAGFIGLQSYWIFRGWCKNHALTIVLGLVGIAVVLGMVKLYMTVVT